jgi:glycyl-tRNA synthetase beta chain
MSAIQKTSVLYEIGSEEIPAGYFARAKSSALKKIPELLSDCGLKSDDVQIFTTPRRIVIYLDEVVLLKAQQLEKLGPPKEQSFENGKPTKALLGFLKTAGKTEKDILFKDSPRGPRVCVLISKERKPIRTFFELLPTAMEFPKLMRWEDTGYQFTRPIRWSLAFIGKKSQKYQIGGVKSGVVTYGHRFLSRGALKVKSASLKDFENLLVKNHVILKQEIREKMIRGFLRSSRTCDEKLITAVSNMVEEPCSVSGYFDAKFLSLPDTVLSTCMSKHQKIFAQYDAKGRLTNRFIAIINGRRSNSRLIARNYESVLRSRLEDARFFFKEDQKESLSSKISELKNMIFLGSLGSYYDKTKRVEVLVRNVAESVGLSRDVIRNVERAAVLSKVDLVTHLVYEFPELQGVAGCEYAKLNGETNEVARAIRDHYAPENLGVSFELVGKQIGIEGAILGICDRFDLLVGAMGLGVKVSSSEDPYALRRAAGGVVKLIRAFRLRLSLRSLIQKNRELFGKLINKEGAEMEQSLLPFFMERVAFELQTKAGTKEYEVLQSILSTGADDLSIVFDKYKDLTSEMKSDSFVRACKVMERTHNILKGSKTKFSEQIDCALLETPVEKNLMTLINEKEHTILDLTKVQKYGKAAKMFGDIFYGPVHDFFDQVMVNVEDPKIRSNRQALVKRVNQICGSAIADLSKVTNL